MTVNISALRDSIGICARLLSGRSISVTQSGMNAYVEYDKHTGEPKRVNIPYIPDNAGDDLLEAVQGFLDHEVAHLLFSNFQALIEGHKRKVAELHNVIEDTMIEREVVKVFPGSKVNLERLRRFMIDKIIHPKLEEVMAAGAPPQIIFQVLGACVSRAWAGQKEFQDYMADKWPLVEPVIGALDKDQIARIPKVKTTWETLEIAEYLKKALTPPPPPCSKPKKDKNKDKSKKQEQEEKNDCDQEGGEGEGEPDETQDDNDESSDDKNSGEPGDEGEESEEKEEGTGSGGKDKKDDDAEETDGSDDKEEQPEKGGSDEADESEEESEEDEEGSGDGDEDESEEEEEGAGDDSEDEEGSSAGGDPEESEEEETDEGEESETDGDEGEEEEEEPEETEGEEEESDGDADEGEEEESEEEPEESEGDGSDDADGEEDEEEGDEGDGNAEEGGEDNVSSGLDGSDSDASDDGTRQESGEPESGDADNADDPTKSESEVGAEPENEDGGSNSNDKEEADAPRQLYMSEEQLEEIKGIEDGLAEVIAQNILPTLADSDYNVFTTEYDVCETPTDYLVERVTPEEVHHMTEKVDEMIGVLQKDLERAVFARTKSYHVPGYRSGKLHGAALHRLKTGDVRVFRRKEEHKTRDIAAMLVLDHSGSMDGPKVQTADYTGYALSSVLERLNIKHEVVGFTTRALPDDVLEELERTEADALAKLGRTAYHDKLYSRRESLYMPIFKKVDERMSPLVRKRLLWGVTRMDLRNNVDGECIQMAYKRLLNIPAARRIMIVASDGMPHCWWGRGLNEHLKKTVGDIEESGVSVFAIGIQDDSVRRFYDRSVVIHDIKQLPAVVMGELRHQLLEDSMSSRVA